jgi:hypothetical protein
MTSTEVALLCRFIRAACPSQAWDEHTAEAWELILPPDYSLDECRAAVITVVRRGSAFIDPAAVIAEVKRVHADDAERERTAMLLDPGRYRADVAAADAAFARKLAGRTGGASLKAIPPPDYDGRAAP